MISDETVAQSAYKAYGYNRDWKDWRGNPMPQWNDLPRHIQVAWIAASLQVKDIWVNAKNIGKESEWKDWSPD